MRQRRTVMPDGPPAANPIPRWLRFVLTSDRAGSAWYIGTGFFFAPGLAVLSPWPPVYPLLWGGIGLAGPWGGVCRAGTGGGGARGSWPGGREPPRHLR